VSFMVVNLATEKDNIDILEQIGGGAFELYQDTEELGLWKLMKGRKETIYIFDSCGYLHKQLDPPKSDMSRKKSNVVTHLKMTLRMKYENCETCMEHPGKHKKRKDGKSGKHGKKHGKNGKSRNKNKKDKKKDGKSDDQ